VWQRRQMPPQQMTTKPTPIERVERTNAVVMRGPGQGMVVPSRRDLYVMEVDRGRNCYTYRGFEHIARHCRNRGGKVAEGRRLEYNGRRKGLYKHENYLKEEENSEILN